MNTLTIELPKETAEKLDLLKQAYERKQVLLSLRALSFKHLSQKNLSKR